MRAANRRPSATLTVTPEGERPFRTTVAAFCRDNADDLEACDVVRGLLPGERQALGGGAAPYFIVRRANSRKRRR